jgi:hypothetical protein
MDLKPIEFLEELIAEPGRFVLCGWSSTHGSSERGACWIKEADGRDVAIRTAGGVRSPIELPLTLWEEFMQAQLIRQDGELANGTVYRPTLDGGRRLF